MPSAAGMAQEAIGFGAFSCSTRHMRQLPAMARRWWKQKCATSTPACWQAWSTVVPGGTSTALPLMVSFGIARPHAAAGGILRYSPMRRSISGRKWRIRPWTGQAAASPSAQMVWPSISQETSSSMSISLDLGLALDHALHHPPHPAGAFAAGRALAAALVLVEFRQPRDRLDDVGRLVHDDDRGGAEAGFDLACSASKSISTVSQIDFGITGTEEPPGMTARRLSQPPRTPPAWRLDQLLERNAHRLFDVARLLDVAGDAEDLGALVLGPADAGEPGRAAAQDGRHDGDALDVVDRGRAAIEPDGGRERRLQARLALLALEAFEQRGFLAADIGAGAAMEIELEIVARAAGVLADQPGGIGLVDRRLESARASL